MDESSGRRKDSLNDHHLSAYNVSVESGIQGAAVGIGSGAYLQGSSSHDYDGSGGAFSIAFWTKISSDIDQEILKKIDTTDGYKLEFESSSNHFIFTGLKNGYTTTVESTTSISTGTWYFLHAGWNPISKEIFIQVNNGTKIEASHTSNLSSTAVFYIGGDGSAFQVDEFALFGSLLDTNEISWIYNSGAGRSFSEYGFITDPTATPTQNPTATPFDYPKNVISDPSMITDQDNEYSPWMGRDFDSSDCGSYSSDFETNYWGITGACFERGLDGYWWTIESPYLPAGYASDGFYQEFNWPEYGDMFLTVWFRSLSETQCSSARLHLYAQGGSNWYLVENVYFGDICGDWQRMTYHFSAGSNCPLDTGCPSTYRIHFMTNESTAYEPECGGITYDHDAVLFVDGVTLSTIGFYGCPNEPGQPEPTTTTQPTLTPSPTGLATNTPWPTATPAATSAGYPTPTPSRTALPFASWTPRPTTTAWPTPTPVYVSTYWLTPGGDWGTPLVPTLAPIATIPAISAAFTPNSTYQARVDAASTSVAFGSIMETRMFTMTDGLISYTVDLDQYIVGSPDLETAFDPESTGTIDSPKFSLKYLAMILAWFKGLMQYIPNLAPFLLAFLAAFLWRFGVVFVGFLIRVIAFLTSLLARIIELILEFIPG